MYYSLQLGTGKRSNLSTPQHLPPLPYPGLVAPAADDLPASGTISPMPHNRMQCTSSLLALFVLSLRFWLLILISLTVAPEMKVNGKRVEETIVAGDGGSAVYWRILNP